VSRTEAQPLPGVWNVPHPRNPAFTGRADELDRLRQNFVRATPRYPVQAVHGLGGIGKTQLALEYVYRFADEYDVVWWLRAGEPASLAADYADLAVALRLPGSVEPGQRAAVEAVRHWLAKHDRWLLVFNGAKEPGDVEGYLPRVLRGHVIITSSNTNWKNLALPLQLKPMKPSEGVELLLHGSAHEDEQAAARELVKELGALPLALAQARGYMEQAGTSVSEYLRRLHDQSKELMKRGTAGPDAAPVATAWEIAFQEAKERSPAAVELLALCAFLAHDDIPADALRRARGLPPALAAAVSDAFAFDDAVSALRRYSFIEWHGDALSMHRLVQAAARDRLGEEDRRRWAELAVGLVCDAFPDVPDDPAQRGACRRWLPHAQAALAHARAAGLPAAEPAERLLRHAAHYQHDIGFEAPAREMLEQALRLAEAVHGGDHPHVAMAHCGLGEILLRTGGLEGARRHVEQALHIDEKNHGPESAHVATDLRTLAAILKEAHALDQARRHAERALRIDMIFPDNDASVAKDENTLGAILRELGDREGARRCFENAIAIDEKRRTQDLPLHLNNLGLLLREMKELDEAEKLTDQALLIGIETYGPDDPQVATFHSNRASVLQEIGNRDYERALREGVQREEAKTHLDRRLEGAKTHYERALVIGEQIYGSDHYVVAIRCNNLALVLLDLDDHDGAKKYFDRAVAIARKALGPDHARVRKLEMNRDAAAKKRKPRLVPR
jgi:tetratricopeptide (TPR) repeat protein